VGSAKFRVQHREDGSFSSPRRRSSNGKFLLARGRLSSLFLSPHPLPAPTCSKKIHAFSIRASLRAGMTLWLSTRCSRSLRFSMALVDRVGRRSNWIDPPVSWNRRQRERTARGINDIQMRLAHCINTLTRLRSSHAPLPLRDRRDAFIRG